MKQKFASLIAAVLLSLVAAGCGEKLPFEYQYTSPSVVQIKYMGKVYELDRFGEAVETPFAYQFEEDGDIDITIEGKTYDIDSPYDIDKPKTRKLKKKVKKTTTRKTKRKR